MEITKIWSKLTLDLNSEFVSTLVELRRIASLDPLKTALSSKNTQNSLIYANYLVDVRLQFLLNEFANSCPELFMSLQPVNQ